MTFRGWRHRLRATITVVLLLAAMPYAARAQSDSASTRDDRGGVPNWAWQQCLAGLTYGQPFKLALSYGGGLVHESMTGGADICAFGAAKVGFGAARGTIGIGRSNGPLGSGVALSGGVMRTFAGAWGATPRRTYVGGGITVWPLLGLGAEVGYYVRLGDAADTPTRQRHIITWSAGFGF